MGKKLVWISNTYDPRKPDANDFAAIAIDQIDQTRSEAIASYRQWLADRVIGKPQATEKGGYTAAELKVMGLVGVYKWVEEFQT